MIKIDGTEIQEAELLGHPEPDFTYRMPRSKQPTQRSKRLIAIKLEHKCECDCGELIEVNLLEALHFEVVECPRCGTDAYYGELIYEEGQALKEELEL